MSWYISINFIIESVFSKEMLQGFNKTVHERFVFQEIVKT